MCAVTDVVIHDPDSFEINLVFCFPGSLGDFNFRGVEVGKFSRKQKTLRVDVYVPPAMYNDERLTDFFLDSSRHAVELAAMTLEKKKCRFDKAKCLQLIDRAAKILRSTTHN